MIHKTVKKVAKHYSKGMPEKEKEIIESVMKKQVIQYIDSNTFLGMQDEMIKKTRENAIL